MMHAPLHRTAAAVLLGLFAMLSSCAKPKEMLYGKLGGDDTALIDPDTKKPFDGIAKDFHKNGQLSMEIPMKNGKFHGTVKEWYPNGSKKAETEFADGKRNGKCTEWTAAGQLFVECVYDHDKPVSRKEYTSPK